jgi:hypothetical protein
MKLRFQILYSAEYRFQTRNISFCTHGDESYFAPIQNRGRSRGSSVSIAADYGLDDRGSILDRQRIFLLASASRSALGPTQPPVQWVPGERTSGVKRGRGVMLTTHPHLVPRLSMSRSCTSSPPPPMCLHGMQRDSFTFFTKQRITIWRSVRLALYGEVLMSRKLI